MPQAKKLIEVALPLEAINDASASETARYGHPSTLHLWWARRPLASARAVIFATLMDDPDDPNATSDFVDACNALPKGKNVEANGDTPRMRLFDFIERLVTWEATTDEVILNTARELIQIVTKVYVVRASRTEREGKERRDFPVVLPQKLPLAQVIGAA